ncbi:hypothetical protein [Jeotgalibaca sp. A127]|uniref:hypothetical protein n=1 Tax=Jeotgalibaca sp. A127 TaxID=3457324 RepID=UPI003FD143A4
MGLFNWFRKSDQNVTRARSTEILKPDSVEIRQKQPDTAARSEVDFTLPIDDEEKEVVSVIVSSIAAEHYSGKKFHIKKITRIDTDKEIAAAIVGAIAANDQPDANFVLRKIERIN